MEANREKIEIITPIDKHKVALKTWITGRERRELKKPFMESLKVSLKGKGEDVEKTGIETGKSEYEITDSLMLMEKAENKAIEIIVESVDGKKENILDVILDMHEDDYNFVVKAINKLTKKKTKDFSKPK